MLAKHQDVQTRLREELLGARSSYGNEIPYDELSALPFLDAVVRETLRVLVLYHSREKNSSESSCIGSRQLEIYLGSG